MRDPYNELAGVNVRSAGTILTVVVGAKGKSLLGAAIPRSLGRYCGDR